MHGIGVALTGVLLLLLLVLVLVLVLLLMLMLVMLMMMVVMMVMMVILVLMMAGRRRRSCVRGNRGGCGVMVSNGLVRSGVILRHEVQVEGVG